MPLSFSLDTVGPLEPARCANNALMLRVIGRRRRPPTRQASGEPGAGPMSRASTGRSSGLRVAVPANYFLDDADAG